MPGILVWTAVAIAATVIIWKDSNLLETSSERLSAHYRLPGIVQGAVVVAIGSSFPELSTVIISASLHGAFDIGVAAIFDPALFNILVIPGLAGLVGHEQLSTNRDLVYKESQFYMIAVAVLTLAFAFAAIYYPVERAPGTVEAEVTRGLALVPLLLYLPYVLVQYHMCSSSIRTRSITRSRRICATWVSRALSGRRSTLARSSTHPAFCGALPWWPRARRCRTPSYRSARHAAGRGITSLANVLGSNVFDLLVCIPVGVLIAGASVINFSVRAPMMGALTAATIALFLMMRTHMFLSRVESALLLGLYLGFVIWISAESFSAINLVPGRPRLNEVTASH